MTDELVIKFHSDVPEEVIDLILDNYAADRRHTNSAIGWHKIKVAAENCAKICEALDADPAVQTVFFNHANLKVQSASFTPNDLGTGWLNQWQLRAIDIERAWGISTGNENTLVSIADAGFEFTHVDMQKPTGGTRFLLPGLNTYADPPNTTNLGVYGSQDHGVMVAGILGATGNNGKGIAGVNWKCQIIPFKASADGFVNGITAATTPYALVLAMTTAADMGSRVHSASYILDDEDSAYWPNSNYTPVPASYYQDAIDYALSKGCIVGLCAGNSGVRDPTPYDVILTKDVHRCLFVAATTKSGHRVDYSQFGTFVTLAAPIGGSTVQLPARVVPGTQTPCTTMNNSYDLRGGTSSAVPMVMGVASLAVGIAPNLTGYQHLALMRAATDKLDARHHDEFVAAYGQINAYKANRLAQLALPGGAPRPTVIMATPQHNSTVYTGNTVIGDNQTVTFEAIVFDENPVQSVSLYVDGSETPYQTMTQEPFSCTWRPSGVGVHTFQFKAVSASGVGVSPVTTLHALAPDSTVAPFVGIISHRDGDTVSGTIDVAAAASSWALPVQTGTYWEPNVYITSLNLAIKQSGVTVTLLPQAATGGIYGQLTIPANVSGPVTLEATAVASNGLTSTTSVGLVAEAPQVLTVPATGAEGTAQAGTATAQGTATVAATGAEGTAQIGTAAASSAQAATAAATGFQATAEAGTATAHGDGTVMALLSVEINCEYGIASAATSQPALTPAFYLRDAQGRMFGLRDNQGRTFAFKQI